MKPGITGRTFGVDHPLDGDILLAAVNGFTHLDIMTPKLERYLGQGEYDIRDLTRLFLRTQPGALDGLAVEFGAEAPDELVARADALFKQARRVGAATVIVRPAPTESGDDEIVAALTALAGLAQRWSVRLAIEPVSARAPRPVQALAASLSSYSGLRALLERVNQVSVGFLVDTVAIAREGAPDRLATFPRERVVHVHLADAAADGSGPRLLPGAGELPLVDMVAALAATGYDGVVAVALAPDSAPDAPGELARTARAALEQLLTAAGIAPSR